MDPRDLAGKNDREPLIDRGSPSIRFESNYRVGYSAGIGTATRLSMGTNSLSPDPV